MSDKNHWLLGEKTACGLPTNRANYGCRTRQMFLALNPQTEQSPYKRLELKRPAEYRPLVSMTGSKP